MFDLLQTSPRSRARLGRLNTTRGTIDTPVFMPVGTQASVKALDLRELNEIGTEILLGTPIIFFFGRAWTSSARLAACTRS
jgi:queuine tRNA-ribosyltransferase